ncbi:MAG: tRNA (adenosine(37)-N6)-dimethylallyltransferase MiaA [Spirochaetales bacterium]
MSEHLLPQGYTCLIILGPTAVGKTALAVRLAEYFKGEIISADSRQVYCGLNIGSGKDLDEYTVAYHLIDITDLSHEYSVYDYQKDFYTAFTDITKRNIIPIIAGGTGMYLDAIVRAYDLVNVPCNEKMRAELAGSSMEELTTYLVRLKKATGKTVHNDTDLTERHRLLRAIEIELFNQSSEKTAEKATVKRPDIRPFIIGTTFPRDMLRANIKRRLSDRFQSGMIEEVEELHKIFSWERLERLGLEYRFIAQYLQGDIASRDELEQRLCTAIGQFAKRQETWYRGMEKKGVHIQWLPHDSSKKDCHIDTRFAYSLSLLGDNA